MKLRIVENLTGVRPVPVGPGLAAISPVTAIVEDYDGYDLTIRIVVEAMQGDRAGRFVCESLTVERREGGPPVTLAAVQAIPVAEVTRAVAADNVQSFELGPSAASMTMRDYRMPPDVASQGPTPEALWWVAHVYRRAVVLGDPPTVAVAENLGLARSTAGRWVSRARKDGYLGASEGAGKAGG